MKKKLVVLSLVLFGVQGIASANYPSEGESYYGMLDLETTQPWGVSKRAVEPHNPFPFGGGPIGD